MSRLVCSILTEGPKPLDYFAVSASIADRSITAMRSAIAAYLLLLSEAWKAVTMLWRWNGLFSHITDSDGSISAMRVAALLIVIAIFLSGCVVDV
jgi:hypothetical protein